MAKTRDILKHVTVEVGDHKRKCHHSRGQHSIPKDTPHLAVKGGAFGARKNYCPDCAKPILANAKARLAQLAKELGV